MTRTHRVTATAANAARPMCLDRVWVRLRSSRFLRAAYFVETAVAVAAGDGLDDKKSSDIDGLASSLVSLFARRMPLEDDVRSEFCAASCNGGDATDTIST